MTTWETIIYTWSFLSGLPIRAINGSSGRCTIKRAEARPATLPALKKGGAGVGTRSWKSSKSRLSFSRPSTVLDHKIDSSKNSWVTS